MPRAARRAIGGAPPGAQRAFIRNFSFSAESLGREPPERPAKNAERRIMRNSHKRMGIEKL
jgi:hypothetical protein